MQDYVTAEMRKEAFVCAVETAAYNGYKELAEEILKDATFSEILYYTWGMDNERHYMVMKIAAEFTGELWQVRPLMDQREHNLIKSKLQSINSAA